MYFDRFDIVGAYYLVGRDYHGGQFTKEYAYLGRCHNLGFKPGDRFEVDSLTDNGRAIYDQLVWNMEKAELVARANVWKVPSHRIT